MRYEIYSLGIKNERGHLEQLGAIIEAVSNQSFSAFMDTHIFSRLGCPAFIHGWANLGLFLPDVEILIWLLVKG
ncbi:hypothetical protein [Paenibacillus sp. KN14-4R]|uniref:hypothetical protein n=1 Tax=Paenibacillus sp. KN14-4R TaxID=3445773 RepID=UPI003FA12ADA